MATLKAGRVQAPRGPARRLVTVRAELGTTHRCPPTSVDLAVVMSPPATTDLDHEQARSGSRHFPARRMTDGLYRLMIYRNVI